LRVVILSAICLVAFSSRLFSVIRFESVIHEFDPWFNYRATRQLVESGYYDFLNWFVALACMLTDCAGSTRRRGIPSAVSSVAPSIR
jgi:hypothetical protein